MPTPPACPVCGALVPAAGLGPVLHIEWHANTDTLNGWNVYEARTHMRAAVDAYVDLPPAHDETLRLPPITDTVRRRPPVPAVRDLAGSELLRALADAIDADPDTAGEEL